MSFVVSTLNANLLRSAARVGRVYYSGATATAPTIASSSRSAAVRLFGRGCGVRRMRRFGTTPVRGEQFHDADRDTFTRAISGKQSEGKVVLVDFYADWCGPCRMISPILEKLTGPAAAGEVKTGSGRALDLVTVDTDAHPELAATYQVSALPTVIAFRDGKPVNKFVGALPEARVREFIAQL